MSTANPLLSVQQPPSTDHMAAAAPRSTNAFPFIKKHLPFPLNPPPFLPLSLSLSFENRHRRHNSATTSTHSDHLQPLNKSNSQNPFHGVFKIFKEFTTFISNNNPLLPPNNIQRRNARRAAVDGGVRPHKPFWSHLFRPRPAIAAEEKKPWDSHGLDANVVVHLNRLSGFKKYKVNSVKFLNPRTRAAVDGADETFSDLLGLQPGGVYTKKDLVDRLESLSSSQFFEKIDLDAKTNPDGSVDINIPFKETIWPSKTRVRCAAYGTLPPAASPTEMDTNMTEKERTELNHKMYKEYWKRIDGARECVLPEKEKREIQDMLCKTTCLRAGLLKRIINKIGKWYNDNGYHGAAVASYGDPVANQGGEIVFEVVEGDLTKLGVTFHDKLGNACEGNTNIGVIKRALPEEVAVGKIFNVRALGEAVQNLHSLNLFSSININPEQDKENGGLSAQIELQEHPQKWSEVETKWNIAPGRNGRPTLASLKPGAMISFGHRNIKGLNRSLEGAINLSNLFHPEEGIGYNFEYTHPYLDGLDDPRNRTFQAACFNTSKLSPVFRGGPGVHDALLSVERAGIKATITEEYTRQSKFTYGLVMEDIKTRDEEGNIATRGNSVLFNGDVRANGPPTTLSGTGIDRMAFLQANLTRDNTRFLNGAIVGERDIFQVDQGIGIGTKFPIFNRHKISATRFIPLKKVEEGKGKSPPSVLVLHGLYGGCVGDLANHEAFTIGGPDSVRGYDVGEIGASRNKLEVAAEVRVPLPIKGNAFAYAFAEHGNDLGSSSSVKGNPTKSYMRRGHGSSYGAGLKIGNLRAEYAVDHNTNKGAIFVRFGDRF